MKLEIISRGFKSTIKTPLTFTGLAPFKKDIKSTIILKPSENGISFIFKKERIPADFKYLQKNWNGVHTSSVGNSKVTIYHTEHLLAALSSLEIDSVDIVLNDSNELPDIGYSASEFANRIYRAGAKKIKVKRRVVVIKDEIYFSDSSGSSAILRPSKKLLISALIQFPDPIREQYLQISLSHKAFLEELAWARSFIRRGCDENVWKAVRRELPSFPKDIDKSPIPVFDKQGNWIVAPEGHNEPVRHKILDLVGDLALLGYPVQGGITVIRPGHGFNRKLVKFLGKLLEDQS